MKALTSFDKSLLNMLQGSLPVCPRPFRKMAEHLGSDEATVLARIRFLKEEGYLRRIGTFFNSGKLGYEGTLVALRVQPGKMTEVAQAVNRYPGTTHNYEREGKFNLWFTLLTPKKEVEHDILKRVRRLPGVDDMINLRSNRKYKINVQFKLA